MWLAVKGGYWITNLGHTWLWLKFKMSTKLISRGTAGSKLSANHSQIILSHTYYPKNMEVPQLSGFKCFYFCTFKNMSIILAT